MSLEQAHHHTLSVFDFVLSLAWHRRLFLEDLHKMDDIPCSLSDIEVRNEKNDG